MKKRIISLQKDERGIIAIEVIVSFIAFLLCMAFVITWINISAAQTRIGFALTQTAAEVSFYAHALEIIGVTGFLRDVDYQASGTRNEINQMMDGVFGAWDGITGIRDNVGGVTTPGQDFAGLSNSITELVSGTPGDLDAINSNVAQSTAVLQTWGDNPAEFFQGLMWVGTQTAVQTGLNAFFGDVIAPSFFRRYMSVMQPRPGASNPTRRGQFHEVANYRAYLTNMPIDPNSVDFTTWDIDLRHRRGAVSGIGIQDLAFLAGPNADEVILSVRYDLMFSRYIGALAVIPQEMREVRQQVMARAWVGDDGRTQLPNGYMMFRPGLGNNHRGTQ